LDYTAKLKSEEYLSDDSPFFFSDVDFDGLGLCAQELEDLIVHKAKLWLDSGRIFGKCGRGFQRINVACPQSTLKEALERIAEVLPADTIKAAS
jgi:cystathionine beta-lyase